MGAIVRFSRGRGSTPRSCRLHSFYPTYFLLCELKRRGVDSLFEQYGACKRNTDFSKGERLGARDHLIVYTKPEEKPEWMSQEEYDRAPATLNVRELQGEDPGHDLSVPQGGPQQPPEDPLSQPLERGAGSAKSQDNARHGAAASQEPADGHQEAMGLPTGLQSDSSANGAVRTPGRSDPSAS